MLPARLLAAERKRHPRVAVTATAAAAAKAMVRGRLMLANVGPASRTDNGLSRLRHGRSPRNPGPAPLSPAISWPPMEVSIRRARTGDVRSIRRLIDLYATERRLLSKATVALYEDVQDFWVAADGDAVVG